MPKQGIARWLGLAALVIVLDQLTKYVIVRTFHQVGQTIPVCWGFNLVLAHNRGAAFSFLDDAGGWQRQMFTVLALVVSAVIVNVLRTVYDQWRISLALALIMGGALGNVIDRIRLGWVIDFIQVYYHDHFWPAFNVADSAICVGAALLVLDSMMKSPKSA